MSHDRGLQFHQSRWWYPIVLDRGIQLSTKHSEEVIVYSSSTHMLYLLRLANIMTKLSSMSLMLHTKNLLHEVAIASSKGASWEKGIRCKIFLPLQIITPYSTW